MEEFKTYRMGDLFTLEYGKPVEDKESLNGPIPVFGTNGQIGTSHLPPLCTHPSIILGRKGAYRGVHYSDKPFSVIDTAFYVEPICDAIDIKWLYYKLLTYDINSMDSGSAIPSTDRYQIYSLPIDVPAIDVQKHVVRVLDSLNNKITVNNCINHNLEEQAQALYKSWFVDFKPFKDGKFVDSELGMIPEGWRVGRIADMVADTYNGDWGKEDLAGAFTKRVFCIRGADIPSLRVGSSGKMPIRFIQDKHFQSKYLKDGDIVVEISGGSPTQSTGRYCRISESLVERYGNSLICTNFCKAVRPLEGYSFFLSLLWDCLYDDGVMFSYENGTTGIKNLDLAGLLAGEPVVIPTYDIVQSFSQLISSLNQQVLFNGHENEQLAAQRDTLLPKLMSNTINLTC